MPNIQSVKDNNDLLTRIIKYIPAEIITLYTSCVAILGDPAKPEDCTDQSIFKWLAIILIVVTPIWKFYAVKDNDNPSGGSKLKAAFFNAAVAMISITIYIYVSANHLLLCWIGEANFSPKAGAIILLVFSILLVPLLENIILRKPSTPPPSGSSN